MNARPCPLEVPPAIVDCPAGCGYSAPAARRWLMQVHTLVGACRNRPKTVVR